MSSNGESMRNNRNHTPMSQDGRRLTDFAFVPPHPVIATGMGGTP